MSYEAPSCPSFLHTVYAHTHAHLRTHARINILFSFRTISVYRHRSSKMSVMISLVPSHPLYFNYTSVSFLFLRRARLGVKRRVSARVTTVPRARVCKVPAFARRRAPEELLRKSLFGSIACADATGRKSRSTAILVSFG